MSNQNTELSDLTTVNESTGLKNQGGTVSKTNADTAVESSESTEPQRLPKGVIFEVLKNERRRRTIRYLREADGVVTLGEVAKHIAALENDKDVEQVNYAERKRVYVGLYQCHLPKMDDMGIVDFNKARGRIELTEEASQLRPYLDDGFDQRPWYRYYAGLSTVGLGVLALSVLSVLPAVPALAPVVLGFGLISAVHAYDSRVSDTEA